MSGGGGTAAILGVIAAKRREDIFRRFRERAALSASSALTLEELSLPKRGMFRMQTLKGAVVEVDVGRYYLDEDVVERQQQIRRFVVLGLLGLMAVALLFFWLAG